jgi:hypothetical protein
MPWSASPGDGTPLGAIQRAGDQEALAHGRREAGAENHVHMVQRSGGELAVEAPIERVNLGGLNLL